MIPHVSHVFNPGPPRSAPVHRTYWLQKNQALRCMIDIHFYVTVTFRLTPRQYVQFVLCLPIIVMNHFGFVHYASLYCGMFLICNVVLYDMFMGTCREPFQNPAATTHLNNKHCRVSHF